MFETIFLEEFSVISLVDISIVSLLIYYFYRAVSKTRALPVFLGAIFIVILSMLTYNLRLETLSFILDKVLGILPFAVVILYPAEIRRALYIIGQRIIVSDRKKVKRDNLDIIISAACALAAKKTGAIIIIEKNDALSQLINSGNLIESKIDQGLILSIFQRESPLHDGALVIGNNKILSAACYISNLSSELPADGKYGSRHRAGLGISEQSDAAVVLVSEETGHISLAQNSILKNKLNEENLRRHLYKIFKNES